MIQRSNASLVSTFATVVLVGCSLHVSFEPRAEPRVVPSPRVVPTVPTVPTVSAVDQLPLHWVARSVSAEPLMGEHVAVLAADVPHEVRVSMDQPSAVLAIYPAYAARSVDDGATWERMVLPRAAIEHSVSIDEHGDVYWLTAQRLWVRRVGAERDESLASCPRSSARALLVGHHALYVLCARGEGELGESLRMSVNRGLAWSDLAVPEYAGYTLDLAVDEDGGLAQFYQHDLACGGLIQGRSSLSHGASAWLAGDPDSSEPSTIAGRGGWGYHAERDYSQEGSVMVLYAQSASERRVIAKVVTDLAIEGSYNGRETLLVMGDRMLVMSGPSLVRTLSLSNSLTEVRLDARQRLIVASRWGLLRSSDGAHWERLDGR
ncbi:MAG: hypothetical protein Q8Q09_00185 [Deltaproteobacteria bacterium]|nr:hypothetical protein [Deltaproteobacteria bacterium]